ncbi:MAG: cytochrome b [Proteobacteria bacterium]|nr:cytochrome b [Pseudomonadota bacterium]MBI3498706.1 cytochrome b [Pseudomonadota bacterium]
MALKNTAESYGSVSKWVHWLAAAMVLAMYLLALAFTNMEEGAAQKSLVTIHQSVGLIILAVAVFRVLWRRSDPRPPLPDDMPRPERLVARSVQAFLYLALLILPVTGYVFANAFGDEVSFFGLAMPRLLEKHIPIRNTAWFFHQWTAYLMLAALALHLGGALYHHFVRRDAVLKRMLPRGGAD